MNSCRSASSATSSARRAELSTATTTQMIATATITPIGTTILRRMWLQPTLRVSPISDRVSSKRSPGVSSHKGFHVKRLADNGFSGRTLDRIIAFLVCRKTFRHICGGLDAAFRAVPLIRGKNLLPPDHKFGTKGRDWPRLLADILVGRARDPGMGGPQRGRPAFAQVMEIRFPRLDPEIELGIADVAARDENIERQAHAEVRAHGGIDRDQTHLERIVEIDVVGDGAVEHGLAVLVLADLQVRRVLGAFDEIAGGVEHEQPRPLALDLAAQQERDIEPHVGGFERPAFELVQVADGAPDALRRLEHGRGIHQRFELAGLGIFPALTQDADDRLADREVAGRGDRHDLLARLNERMELAEGRNIVDARIGAGVGKHHEAVADQDATAIRHDRRTTSKNTPLYTDLDDKPAMLLQFCVCCAAWCTRTLTASASPAPP